MRIAILSENCSSPLMLGIRQSLRAREGGHALPLMSLQATPDSIARLHPDALIVALSPAAEIALATIISLRSKVEGKILAVGPAAEPKLIMRALQAGADAYIDESDADHQLAAALSRIQPSQASDTANADGRLIAFLGASGGCGTSSVAVNVAAALALKTARSLLIDLKPRATDLAALLDMKPNHTLADLSTNASRLDFMMLERSLCRHSSGLAFIPCSRKGENPTKLNFSAVEHILVLARSFFDFTVVDLEDCFHVEQVQAVRSVDELFIVLRLDFASLRNTRRILEEIDRLGVPRSRIRLVANRSGQPSELPIAKAEEALGMRVIFRIPEDPKVMNLASNTGLPAVMQQPTAKASRHLTELAHAIFFESRGALQGPGAEPADEKKTRGGILSRLPLFFASA